MEDKDILSLFWQRDQKALLYTEEKYGPACRLLSRRITGSPEDAEECVNDSYYALWKAIPPGRPDNFGAYVFKTVRNRSLDRLRQQKASRRGGGETGLILEELEQCLPGGSSTEAEAELRELSRLIAAFARGLSPADRNIFTARYFLALPQKEIARRLAFRESRVNSSLHRSREKLRRQLIKEGYL